MLGWYNRVMKTFKIILVATLAFFVVLGFTKFTSFFKSPAVIQKNETSVIKEIQDLKRLETASFTIEKVIERGKDGNFIQNLIFKDKILLIAHAEVVAGFDFKNFSDQNIRITNGVLSITLPAPEILFTRLDNEKTRVYDRQSGLLTKGNKDLESEARLEAEQLITKDACDAQILDRASENADKILRSIYKQAGFTDIQISIPKSVC